MGFSYTISHEFLYIYLHHFLSYLHSHSHLALPRYMITASLDYFPFSFGIISRSIFLKQSSHLISLLSNILWRFPLLACNSWVLSCKLSSIILFSHHSNCIIILSLQMWKLGFRNAKWFPKVTELVGDSLTHSNNNITILSFKARIIKRLMIKVGKTILICELGFLFMVILWNITAVN